MKHLKISGLLALPAAVALLLLLSTAFVYAQTGGSYDLSWFTVDSGGGASRGGSYALIGTAGQPDAGMTLSGGTYTLVSGLWPGGSSTIPGIYLPVILRQ